jgi:hypothetical protein
MNSTALASSGGNDEGIQAPDIDRLFQDFLAMIRYRTIGSAPTRKKPATPINSNEDFWLSARELHEGQRVELRTFLVLEWLPSSPGRYFTDEAKENRLRASSLFDSRNQEYIPLGKLSMILGGVGSVRLSAKDTPRGKMHILGATSILCDFDEYMEHFESPVGFKISDLFKEQLDANVLRMLQRKYGVAFTVHNQYGDVFTNISGSTITNRSVQTRE